MGSADRRLSCLDDFEEDDQVKVVAVGHKEHNDLYIRGRKVEL